jgi:3-oxoacyl-[acyl-carrier protein] reductase
MKRYLVTGGSRGIGLAVCAELLRQGHEVLATSRHSSEDLKVLLRAHEARLRHVEVDLGSPGATSRLSAEGRLLDGIDGFVANAAVGTEGLLTLSSEKAIRECLEVNLISTLLLCREVLKGMLERGGSIVLVSSVAARSGFAGLSVYSASKGALLSLSRSLAREYGSRGIRVNCVLPGFVDTEMTGRMSEDDRARILRRTPVGRIAECQDIVGTITFLLSDQARHITGTEVVVDGGMSA